MSNFDDALDKAKAEAGEKKDARSREKEVLRQRREDYRDAIARFREIMEDHAAEVEQWRCVVNGQPAWIVRRRRSHHLADGWETSEIYLLDNDQFLEAERQSREYPSQYYPQSSLQARESVYSSQNGNVPDLLARAVVELMHLDV
ncbi:hypothetical protein AB0E69_23510 [Kribbella sp. NPDC026611]|uniref:hypothetical protein n=1 Tax=Kribbella sp. NPDC026611 TaxID=3154911 RepID=UPI0033F9960E